MAVNTILWPHHWTRLHMSDSSASPIATKWCLTRSATGQTSSASDFCYTKAKAIEGLRVLIGPSQSSNSPNVGIVSGP